MHATLLYSPGLVPPPCYYWPFRRWCRCQCISHIKEEVEAGLTTTVCVGKRRNASVRLAQIRFLLLINCVLGGHESNSIVICVSTRERDSFLSSTLRTSMKFQTFIIFFFLHSCNFQLWKMQLPLRYPSRAHTYRPDWTWLAHCDACLLRCCSVWLLFRSLSSSHSHSNGNLQFSL